MKLIECPNCKNTKLRILLINQFKKRHFYLIWCLNCDWTQKFHHPLGFNGCESPIKDFFKIHEPYDNKEQLQRRGRLNEE